MTTSPSPRSGALPIYIVLAVAFAAGLGLFLGQRWSEERGSMPALQGGLAYPEPRKLPEFALDTARGPLSRDDLHGQWTLLFIGFTHCPDICPTTLAQLGQAERIAERGGGPVPQILFVSVDPERDSVERIAEYAGHFSPRAWAATADHDRLLPFTRSLGMVYMQTPLDDDDYTVDHSASVAVINPDARLVAQLRSPLDPATIAADLRRLAGAHR